MATVFSLSGLLVLPLWVLLILLPGWNLTARIARSPLVSLAPALLYAALVVPRLGVILPAVLRPELGAIAGLLGSPEGATIAWAHFLAFDLFVGRWVYLDAKERAISSWIVSPILFLVLMVGPVGFVLYLGVRACGAASRSSPD
jgi:hypothetical protein